MSDRARVAGQKYQMHGKGCSPGHDGVAITLWQFFMLSFLEISTKRRLRQPDRNDDAGRQASVSIQPCDLHRDISLPLDS